MLIAIPSILPAVVGSSAGGVFNGERRTYRIDYEELGIKQGGPDKGYSELRWYLVPVSYQMNAIVVVDTGVDRFSE